MKLTERAILVSLKIGLPTGTRRDKQATEDVEKAHNARNLGRFNKDLINKKFLANIKSVETKARAYLYAMTVPWGDDDSRLLAVRRHVEFAEKMNGYGAQFDTEASTIINTWPDIVDEARKRLNSLFDPRQYPDAATLPNKFKFRVGYTPVPSSGDVRCALDDAQLREMRQRIDEDVRNSLAQTNMKAWERLYAQVDHMAQRLGDPESRVYDSVVDNLAELCDILPDLNFTDDPRLNKAIALVQQQLLVPVEALRNQPETKENTALAARKIANAMSGWMKKE